MRVPPRPQQPDSGLTELRHIEQKVLVAGGVICAPVIRAALESGYANRLVTDVGTARWLLEASA